MYLFRLGAIYSINYSFWKQNPTRIYIFILWGNPVAPKIHALNLGARELTTVDRAKLVNVIVRLSKVPSSTVYSGRLLYKIFLTYLKPQVKKCYRTYFHSGVTRASLLNYGINKKEEFSEHDLKVYDPLLHQNAKRDYLIQLLNLYTRRGLDLKNVRDQLAKMPVLTKVPTKTEKEQELQDQEKFELDSTEKTTPTTTATTPSDISAEASITKEEPKKPGGGDEFGGIGY